MKVKCDHRSKFYNLSNWKEEARKKTRASTRLEPMTSAIPVRCSTNWAMKPHIGSNLPVKWNYVRHIWNNSYLYCSIRWKWSVIIAVNYHRSIYPLISLAKAYGRHSRWKTCFELGTNLISTKVSASQRKSTQVHARPGQTESKVDPTLRLLSFSPTLPTQF